MPTTTPENASDLYKSQITEIALPSPVDKTAAKALIPQDGVKIYPQGTDGGVFIGGTGKAAGYYDDNGGTAYGTRFKPTGGDGSAGWERPPFEVAESFWFNAIGDGTLKYTELQGAISFAAGNDIPLNIAPNAQGSFYNIGANTLTISRPAIIRTAGSRFTVISATGLSIGDYVIDVDGTAFGAYEDADIGGLTIIANGADCMRVKNASLSNFPDIAIKACRHGIVYTGTRAFGNTFNVRPISGVTGSTVLITAHTGGGPHTFNDSTFGGSNGLSISTDVAIDSLTLNNPNFEQCTSNSAYVGGTVWGLNFNGGRTEGCDGIDFLIDPVTGKSVHGLNINGMTLYSSDAGGADRIKIGGAGGEVKGFSIVGNTVGHGADNFSANLVNLNGAGETGQIIGNFLNGTLALCSPVNASRPGVAVYNNEANDGYFAPQLTSPIIEDEGTFSFTDTSGATLTFTTNSGQWTRVGRLIMWQCVLTFPVTADGSNVALAGLPFDILFGTGAPGRAGLHVDETTSTTVLYGFHGPTVVDEITLRKAGSVQATNTDCSAGTFYLSGSYTTSE